MRKKVLVPIAQACEEIEACCIIDTLRRAGAGVTVASVGELQITASRGVKITADARIVDCASKTYDLIALPGGMPGAEHLRDSQALTEMLKQQKLSGRLYAAICASPAVALQKHKLLDGKKATCHPAMKDELPQWIDEQVVVDGNCITSQGPGTALAFALKLVEALFGAKQAKAVAGPMLIEL